MGIFWALVVAALVGLGRGEATQYAFKHSKELTDATLQAEIEKGKPLLLNLYVPYMGSCRLFAPRWEEVGAALKDSGVTVAHVNLQQNPGVKVRLSVTVAFPYIALIKEGEVTRFTPGRELDAIEADAFVKFATSSEAGKGTPLASVPFVEPWFTTHDYVGRDGKTYKGAVF
jgi:thioredoxin 1